MKTRDYLSLALLLTASISAVGLLSPSSSEAAEVDSSSDSQVESECQKGFRPEGFGPEGIEGIERSVENTTDGVIMTITSDDAEAVEHIQSKHQDGEHFPEGPHAEDEDAPEVTHEVTLLDNGVQIKISSTDADFVAKLQERAEDGFLHGMRHHPGRQWRGQPESNE